MHSINLDYNSDFLENGQVIVHFLSISEHLEPCFSVGFEFRECFLIAGRWSCSSQSVLSGDTKQLFPSVVSCLDSSFMCTFTSSTTGEDCCPTLVKFLKFGIDWIVSGSTGMTPNFPRITSYAPGTTFVLSSLAEIF